MAQTFFELTEEQVRASVAGAHVNTAVTAAIDEADKMAGFGGSTMTVVNTKDNGICIYNGFQMTVAKDEITEEIYCTDGGFIFREVA